LIHPDFYAIAAPGTNSFSGSFNHHVHKTDVIRREPAQHVVDLRNTLRRPPNTEPGSREPFVVKFRNHGTEPIVTTIGPRPTKPHPADIQMDVINEDKKLVNADDKSSQNVAYGHPGVIHKCRWLHKHHGTRSNGHF
jgi:hypothetical protein